MTALGRVSGTGYYCTTVETIDEDNGYLATGRNLMDLSPGFTIGTSTPTASGTASLRGRVAVHGLAASELTLDTVDGLAELMLDMVYPASTSGYSIFQLDMTGNAGLTVSSAGGATMDYPLASRVIRSDGTVVARSIFGLPGITTPDPTTTISARVWRHSSPSQYVLSVGTDSDGTTADMSTWAPLVNDSLTKYGYGFGIRGADATTVRHFNCNKQLDTTVACPTYNCFSGNLAPLMYLVISGTTRALGLEPGTVQDSWPGDGTYYLWQASHNLWKFVDSPGSNPFGATPGFITVEIADNGSNWDMLVLTGGGNRRFERINIAGGQNGLGGTFSTSATAYQTATDGGGFCLIGTGT